MTKLGALRTEVESLMAAHPAAAHGRRMHQPAETNRIGAVIDPVIKAARLLETSGMVAPNGA
jgi:hypothetical protein